LSPSNKRVQPTPLRGEQDQSHFVNQMHSNVVPISTAARLTRERWPAAHQAYASYKLGEVRQ
jgi:hypothetical protein